MFYQGASLSVHVVDCADGREQERELNRVAARRKQTTTIQVPCADSMNTAVGRDHLVKIVGDAVAHTADAAWI